MADDDLLRAADDWWHSLTDERRAALFLWLGRGRGRRPPWLAAVPDGQAVFPGMPEPDGSS